MAELDAKKFRLAGVLVSTMTLPSLRAALQSKGHSNSGGKPECQQRVCSIISALHGAQDALGIMAVDELPSATPTPNHNIAAATDPEPAGFIRPVGGGTSYAGNNKLSGELVLRFPKSSRVGAALGSFSTDADDTDYLIDYPTVAALAARCFTVADEMLPRSTFAWVLSCEGLSAAYQELESLLSYSDDLSKVNFTTAARILMTKARESAFQFELAHFLPVEELDASASISTRKLWSQLSPVTFKHTTNELNGNTRHWADIIAMGCIGRASDRSPGSTAYTVIEALLADTTTAVKMVSASLLKPFMRILENLVLPIAIDWLPASPADVLTNHEYAAKLKHDGSTVMARCESALLHFKHLRAATGDAADRDGAVRRIVNILGHRTVSYDALENTDRELGLSHHDVLEERLPPGSSRVVCMLVVWLFEMFERTPLLFQ